MAAASLWESSGGSGGVSRRVGEHPVGLGRGGRGCWGWSCSVVLRCRVAGRANEVVRTVGEEVRRFGFAISHRACTLECMSHTHAKSRTGSSLARTDRAVRLFVRPGKSTMFFVFFFTFFSPCNRLRKPDGVSV